MEEKEIGNERGRKWRNKRTRKRRRKKRRRLKRKRRRREEEFYREEKEKQQLLLWEQQSSYILTKLSAQHLKTEFKLSTGGISRLSFQSSLKLRPDIYRIQCFKGAGLKS